MSELPPRSRPLIPGQIASWLAVVALVGAAAAASVAAYLSFRGGESPAAVRRGQQVALRAETEAKASALLSSSGRNDDGTYRIPLEDALRVAAERPEILGRLAPPASPVAPAPASAGAFVAADDATMKRGQAVYARTCIACHQPTGMGLPPVFPPLVESPLVNGDPALPIKFVLHGLMGPVTIKGMTYNSIMPPVPGVNDQDIADVLTFVRQSFGNKGSSVTPAQVKAVRDATAGRAAPWNTAELGIK
ncbi:MAG: c-type cytochrome [Opitutales bacterium]